MKKNVLIFILILNFINIRASGPITLDTSFNGTGIKTITGYNAGSLNVTNVAIRADGKIVTFGTNTTTSVTAIFTIDSDGSSFTQFDVGDSTERFTDILVQPDGKYIIVGYKTTTGFAIMRRYVVDETGTGTPDTTFGIGGLVTTTDDGQSYNAILQPDLKIVLSIESNLGTSNFIIRRFDELGTLETPFDETFSGISTDLIQQADGKTIAVGTNLAFDIARFNVNGTLDVTITFSNSIAGTPYSMSILPDGQIIVAGNNVLNFVIAKYSTIDGSVIASHSLETGLVRFYGNGLNLSPNGKPIFLGYKSTSPRFFKIARYNDNLTLDTSDQTLVPGFGYGAAIQSNGYIVAVGVGQLSPFPITIARYVNSNPFAPTTITSPSNGSTITAGKVTFSGTAQTPSNIFLFIDDVFSEGTVTDASGNWIIDPILSEGVHTAYVVSTYKNHKLNIASELITFTVAPAPIPPTPTPIPSNIILAPTFTGTLIFNKFLNKTERIVFAQWPVDPAAVLYKIYKNNQLLCDVRPNGSSILRQAIYLQPCDKISDFSLSFVNTSGIESERAILTVGNN